METQLASFLFRSMACINCTLRNGNIIFVVSLVLNLSINCTLRNGNRRTDSRYGSEQPVLIVPCGMETLWSVCKTCGAKCINCTLRNGNIVHNTGSNRKIRINCTLRNGNELLTRYQLLTWRY